MKLAKAVQSLNVEPHWERRSILMPFQQESDDIIGQIRSQIVHGGSVNGR